MLRFDRRTQVTSYVVSVYDVTEAASCIIFQRACSTTLCCLSQTYTTSTSQTLESNPTNNSQPGKHQHSSSWPRNSPRTSRRCNCTPVSSTPALGATLVLMRVLRPHPGLSNELACCAHLCYHSMFQLNRDMSMKGMGADEHSHTLSMIQPTARGCSASRNLATSTAVS